MHEHMNTFMHPDLVEAGQGLSSVGLHGGPGCKVFLC